MKIKIKGDAPPFVKEFIEFQQSMPRIQMGAVPDDSAPGKATVESIPLNSFIAAFMNEIWIHKDRYLLALGRGTKGTISEEDKMQILWNSMAAFLQSVSLEFGWLPPEMARS